MNYDILILGGGAAGFFTAINIAQKKPNVSIAILERSNEVLSKVRISGGGRCNVTHAQFIPKDLTLNYPRGERELLGPFHHFMTGDTMAWFEDLGVRLKIEEDGRIFPESNTSQTIIDCFITQAKKYGIVIYTKQPVKNFKYVNNRWVVTSKTDEFIGCNLVIASGSNSKIWQKLQDLGHTIEPPVPSLFTFNCTDDRIQEIPGIATTAKVSLLSIDEKPLLDDKNHRVDREGSIGPVLITHWGFSGPAVLKLSALGARALNQLAYDFKIAINWLPEILESDLILLLKKAKLEAAKQGVKKHCPFDLPKRLWQKLVENITISDECRWADLSKSQILALAHELNNSIFRVSGKSTFKEEFVTAGGVVLEEIDFKTFKSKRVPNLYLAGEVLNIDAVTGGFNFQNAWTGGYLAAQAIVDSIHESV